MMRNHAGYTLIEVLVALGLLSVVGVAIYGSLTTATMTTPMVEERTTAADLAERQMEYVMTLGYQHNADTYPLITGTPAGYAISVTTEVLDPENDGTGDDDGLQRVLVTVKHSGDVVSDLEAYKAEQ